jgi:hypothetical protein
MKNGRKSDKEPKTIVPHNIYKKIKAKENSDGLVKVLYYSILILVLAVIVSVVFWFIFE